MTREPEQTRPSVPLRWPTFLRLDRPELDGTEMVIPARPTESRARTRTSGSAPLAYLYELDNEFEPETVVRLPAGHYDADELVWSFSGDVPGIIGITEPTTAS
ncbi:hypothetical protein GCM10010191_51280 [Actinomadura vinacea]|uniref:Uncharacterized protein n=1 Tax=Actinomadura vinacea TaxID=115336 RepID=A0ABP5WQU3_9ACTN